MNTDANILLALLNSGNYSYVDREYAVKSVTPFSEDPIFPFVGEITLKKDEMYSTAEKPRYQMWAELPLVNKTIILQLLKAEAESLPEDGIKVNKEDLFKVTLVRHTGKGSKEVVKYTTSKDFIN